MHTICTCIHIEINKHTEIDKHTEIYNKEESYDLSGEVEQTHLSVNHDFWGTLITYIGYSLLYFGMISILFAPGTRFDSLKKTLKKIKKKKAALTLFIILFSTINEVAQAQENHLHEPSDYQIDSILRANLVDLKHAEEFNKLVDKRLFNIVGYRIPNQALASSDALEVVGILPPNMGDMVITYGEITAKTGSDFDIDKAFIVLPE